jgi:hypothetical protein
MMHYKYIVEEHENEPPEERPEHLVHESLECRRCVAEPDGITQNS